MSTATTTTCLSLLLIVFNIVAIAFLLKIQKQLRNTRNTRNNMIALRKQLTESPRVRSHNDGPTNAKPMITPKPQFPKPRKIKEDFYA